MPRFASRLAVVWSALVVSWSTALQLPKRLSSRRTRTLSAASPPNLPPPEDDKATTFTRFDQTQAKDSISPIEYVFGKPGEFNQDLNRLGSSPRRFFFQVGFVAPVVALSGNLFGVTSALLGTLPEETLSSTRLDTYFPARGFTRWVAPDQAYEFLVPQGWLQDQAVVLARAQQQVMPNTNESLERQMRAARQASMPNPKRKLAGPDVAFGPPERSGDNTENVSVVRQRLMAGFSLRRTLGEPQAAAERLLSTAIAPPGSGRTTELLSAGESLRPAPRKSGVANPEAGLCYDLEYILTRQDGRRVHNLALIMARGDDLFTLTVLAPESEWASKEDKLRRVAQSFRLLYD